MSGEDRDDDALSWAGDDDPTLQSPDNLPTGWSVVGEAGVEAAAAARAEAAAAAAAESGDSEKPPEQPAPMGSVALISLGVIGGILLLYTVGWVISVGRANAAVISTYEGDPLGGFMFMFGGWLAIIAPAIWMCTTLWLTRDGRQRGRILWLLLGLVVLIPWPLLIGAWR